MYDVQGRSKGGPWQQEQWESRRSDVRPLHGQSMHQAREMGRTAGVEIGDVDLAGYTVRGPEELVPTLETALASDAVTLVDVVADLISPSARLSELAEATG